MSGSDTACIVFGDQLDADGAFYRSLDPTRVVLLMVEAADESSREWSHPQRITVFLSAMRHFAQRMRDRGYRVEYLSLGTVETLEEGFRRLLERVRPGRLIARRPGDYRNLKLVHSLAQALSIELTVHEDDRALCSPEEFAEHARGRKALRLEYFYRMMRRRYNVLMDGKTPVGGSWNYDSENRKSFSAEGPPAVPAMPAFLPDETTRAVMREVTSTFPTAPGSIESFSWPVTGDQAEVLFDDFVEQRLPFFGDYQDAMWTGEPLLFHSALSSSLNLGLLDPLKVIARAEQAYRTGHAPLNAVEGLIRQVLGWREFVRGIYWYHMPGYLEDNALQAHEALPQLFWSGDTEMTCLSETVGDLRTRAWTHHIQRLMVTGLFALLYGVHPKAIHDWYMGMYVDSVEWVTAPNTIGMSQYADGGIIASKPYVASGKYIQRMSNYCSSCRFRPDRATGDDACPFSTLYWDFLARHEDRLAANGRMQFQIKNLRRISAQRREEISERARQLRRRLP